MDPGNQSINAHRVCKKACHDIGWFRQQISCECINANAQHMLKNSALFRVCRARKMFAPTSAQTGYGMVRVYLVQRYCESSETVGVVL